MRRPREQLSIRHGLKGRQNRHRNRDAASTEHANSIGDPAFSRRPAQACPGQAIVKRHRVNGYAAGRRRDCRQQRRTERQQPPLSSDRSFREESKGLASLQGLPHRFRLTLDSLAVIAIDIDGVVLIAQPADQRVAPQFRFRDEGTPCRGREDRNVEPADMVGEDQAMRGHLGAVTPDVRAANASNSGQEAARPGRPSSKRPNCEVAGNADQQPCDKSQRATCRSELGEISANDRRGRRRAPCDGPRAGSRDDPRSGAARLPIPHRRIR